MKNPSRPKHPKIIEMKNDLFLFSHFFAVSQEGLMKAGKLSQNLFEAPKASVKMEIYVIFPTNLGLGWQELKL